MAVDRFYHEAKPPMTATAALRLGLATGLYNVVVCFGFSLLHPPVDSLAKSFSFHLTVAVICAAVLSPIAMSRYWLALLVRARQRWAWIPLYAGAVVVAFGTLGGFTHTILHGLVWLVSLALGAAALVCLNRQPARPPGEARMPHY